MAIELYGAVYDPPRPDLPYVVIVFHKGEVLASRVVPNVERGESFLAAILSEMKAKIDRGEI